MSQPSLLTIVLNYKTADMTIKAVEHALKETDGIPSGLTIVDNDSGDGSFELLSETAEKRGWLEGDKVRVLQSGHNGGFGFGNNVGIRAGLAGGQKPDYVYILNSDAFPDPGSVKQLYEYLDSNPDVGFAGSYIHGPDGEPHRTHFRYPTIFSEIESAANFGPISKLFKNYILHQPIPTETVTVDWLAGASMMMRQNVLDEIGLFDERFFLYYEETDLCRRARLAGWPTVYVRTSEVTHIGSVSTGMKKAGRMPGFWFDSRLYYFVKNHGHLYALVATILHVLAATFERILKFLRRKPSKQRPRFLCDMIIHAFTHWPRLKKV